MKRLRDRNSVGHNGTPPRPGSAPAQSSKTPTNSMTETAALGAYINFLTATSDYLVKTKPIFFDPNKVTMANDRTAFDFNVQHPSSPVFYNADETALLLLDFQGFIVGMCGEGGKAALANAKLMRDWALDQGIMVLHSIVNVEAEPAMNSKRSEQLKGLLAKVRGNREAIEEPTEIAFSQQPNEFMVLKTPGVVSGLKTGGAVELLRERDIKSLIICGLSTSGCVLRTAVPATDDGFVVSVIGDACFDPKEGVHEMLMSEVLTSRAHVASAEEFIEAWNGGKDGRAAMKDNGEGEMAD